MSTRKVKVFLVFLLVSAFIFSACGGGSGSSGASAPAAPASSTSDTVSAPAESATPVTLDLMHDEGQEERIQMIQSIIDSFQEQNPNITIVQQPTDEDAFDTKVKTYISSGSVPAIVTGSVALMQMMEEEDVVDTQANADVLDAKGRSNFYDNVLEFTKSERGGDIGVPISGWVAGIWYRTDLFAEKGLNPPSKWEDILAAAEALHDPSNKMYGIMIATEEGNFTQQTFQQFALSNGARLFDDNGQPQFNSPQMKEAIEFYRQLYKYTLPGSNGTTQVRDAMIGGNAAMGTYSTYILGSLYEAGLAPNIGYAIPDKVQPAASGSLTVYTISNTITPEERDGAKAYLSYLLNDEANIKLLHMSPGGAHPVIKSIADNQEYLSVDVLQAYASIASEIPKGFDEMQQFGTQDGKTNPKIGTISNTYVVSKAINQILVQGADLDNTIEKAQQEMLGIVNE